MSEVLQNALNPAHEHNTRIPAHQLRRLPPTLCAPPVDSPVRTMSRHKTIVEQKQEFLQSRKHYLSRGIAPSDKLKQIAHDGGIELSVLKGAVDKGAFIDSSSTCTVADHLCSQP